MELTDTTDPAPRRRIEREGREADDHPPSRRGCPGSPAAPLPPPTPSGRAANSGLTGEPGGPHAVPSWFSARVLGP